MSFESPEEAKIVKKNYEILASIICFKRTQTENDFQNLRELNDLLTYAKNKNFSFKQKNLNLEKLLKIFLQFFLPNAIQRYTEFEKVPLAYSLMAQSSTFPMAPIIDYLICKENIKIEEDISLAIKKSIKYTKDQIAYERVHAIRNIILQYVYEKKYSFIERFVQKKEIEVDNESLKNLLAMLRLHFAISELKQAIKTDSLTKFLSNYIELMNEELKSPTPCDYTLTTQQNIKD